MAVSQVGSTTTSYYAATGASSSTTASTTASTTGTSSASTSSAASTSSTTAVSSTTATSNSASTTSNVGTVSSTTSYSSATAQTTCSTTITYSGASSTAKVSSTTATTATTTTTSTSTTGASSSTTASTTAVSNSSGTPTASVAAITTPMVGATTTNTAGMTSGVTESSTVSVPDVSINVEPVKVDVASDASETPTYAYLSHMGGESLIRAEQILVECGYDDAQDGNLEEALIKFKEDVGLSEYTTHSYEVASELFALGEEIDRINGDVQEGGVSRIENVRNILEGVGFLDEDRKLISALGRFRDATNLGKYGIFSENVLSEVEKLSDYVTKNENFGAQLKELGFFNPESNYVSKYSVQADSAPSNIYKCLENFCNVYGVENSADNMDNIMAKIDEVHTYYKEILNSEKTDSVLKSLGANAESQKINFSKSWTFLKLGMKFEDASGNELVGEKKDELISAILANWFEEGAFSETNMQNRNGNNAIDDSLTYKFSSKDEIGFGIMQWTIEERKTLFEDVAEEMKSGVGNINVQFALFKSEISVGGTEYGLWKRVLNGKTVAQYTEKFLLNMENPRFYTEQDKIDETNHRIETANKIYNGMVN